MKLTVNGQRGIGALGGIAVIIVLLGIGFIGWFVYQSQQSADKTLNTTNSSSDNSASAADKTASSKPEQTTFSKLPQTLQDVVVGQTTVAEPSCVKDNKLVDIDGKATDPDATYQASGFAVTRIGCDPGASGLFVKDGKDWKFVATTQMNYKCADLKANKVPLAFLQAIPANKDLKQIECTPDDPNATQAEVYKG